VVNTVLDSEVVSIYEGTDVEVQDSQVISLLEYQAPAQIDISQIVSVLEYHLGVAPPDPGGGGDPGGPPGGGGLLGDRDICEQL
jgi:hypothetical protein